MVLVREIRPSDCSWHRSILCVAWAFLALVSPTDRSSWWSWTFSFDRSKIDFTIASYDARCSPSQASVSIATSRSRLIHLKLLPRRLLIAKRVKADPVNVILKWVHVCVSRSRRHSCHLILRRWHYVHIAVDVEINVQVDVWTVTCFKVLVYASYLSAQSLGYDLTVILGWVCVTWSIGCTTFVSMTAIDGAKQCAQFLSQSVWAYSLWQLAHRFFM